MIKNMSATYACAAADARVVKVVAGGLQQAIPAALLAGRAGCDTWLSTACAANVHTIAPSTALLGAWPDPSGAVVTAGASMMQGTNCCQVVTQFPARCACHDGWLSTACSPHSCTRQLAVCAGFVQSIHSH